MTLRVAVLASGRGSNLVALLEAIRKGLVQARVTLVLSDKPDAPVLEEAKQRGVPAVLALPAEPGEKRAAYDARVLAALQAEKPDLVVLAGYMRIVGPELCHAFTGRMVNIHPALLPAFRGLKAQAQAIEAGVRLAGCTTHLVTDDLDGGPILLQAALPVRHGESVESLSARILRLEHLLLPRTVQLFAEGRVEVAGKTARIAPGPTWLKENRVDLVAGALYGDGF